MPRERLVLVHVKVPVNVRNNLKRAAKAEARSVSNFLRELIINDPRLKGKVKDNGEEETRK